MHDEIIFIKFFFLFFLKVCDDAASIANRKFCIAYIIECNMSLILSFIESSCCRHFVTFDAPGVTGKVRQLTGYCNIVWQWYAIVSSTTMRHWKVIERSFHCKWVEKQQQKVKRREKLKWFWRVSVRNYFLRDYHNKFPQFYVLYI